MTEKVHHADVVIAGAGLAGLVAAHELLEHGKTVLLLDKDVPEKLGGLAKESFGGVHLIGTPQQKRTGISDSPELALRDWLSYARFGEDDSWPRLWAELYCDRSLDLIHAYLHGGGGWGEHSPRPLLGPWFRGACPLFLPPPFGAGVGVISLRVGSGPDGGFWG